MSSIVVSKTTPSFSAASSISISVSVSKSSSSAEQSMERAATISLQWTLTSFVSGSWLTRDITSCTTVMKPAQSVGVALCDLMFHHFNSNKGSSLKCNFSSKMSPRKISEAFKLPSVNQNLEIFMLCHPIHFTLLWKENLSLEKCRPPDPVTLATAS